MGRTVQELKPGENETFRTHPDRPWGLSSVLYSGQGSFLGVEQLGCGVDHPAPGRGIDHWPPSSADIKEWVQLYFNSPSGPSWRVLGWPLTSNILPYAIQVSHELRSLLRESVPYVKIYRYNSKHLCPKLNGYGDNGQRSLKLWQLLHTYWLPNTY